MNTYRDIFALLAAGVLVAIIALGNLFILMYSDDFFRGTLQSSLQGDGMLRALNVRDFVVGHAELETGGFTAQEQNHLIDVQQRITSTIDIFYSLVLLEFILMYFMFKSIRSLREAGSRLKWVVFPAAAFAVIVCALLALAAIDFDTVFGWFHQPLFAEGTWRFPADSFLLALFPQGFFFTFFKNVVLTTALQGLAVLLFGIVALSPEQIKKIVIPSRRHKS